MPKLISSYIRDQIAKHLSPHTLDAVLTKSTNGTRTSSVDGTNPTPVDYPCKGFVQSFEESAIDGTLVRTSDRWVKLLGGTLPVGVEPEVGNKIAIEDPPESGTIKTYRIVGGNDGKGVKRDPVGATYTCHGREA